MTASLAALRSEVDNVMKHAPNAMLLLVSNPVDVLTYHAYKQTGWPRERVFGLSGELDSARMASFVAQASGYSVRDITALGGGGRGGRRGPRPGGAGGDGSPIR